MIELPAVCLHKLSHDRDAVTLKFLRREILFALVIVNNVA